MLSKRLIPGSFCTARTTLGKDLVNNESNTTSIYLERHPRMPDFDIDFCYEKRQQVIDYVVAKYGADHVAQIITFGTMAARGSVRDVGRVLGMPYGDVDAVAKLIPSGPGALHITLEESLKLSK